MLVLSRKLNESIVINGSIVVTVLESSRGRVRLGIEAPASVPVHRQELFDVPQESRPIVAAACEPLATVVES